MQGEFKSPRPLPQRKASPGRPTLVPSISLPINTKWVNTLRLIRCLKPAFLQREALKWPKLPPSRLTPSIALFLEKLGLPTPIGTSNPLEQKWHALLQQALSLRKVVVDLLLRLTSPPVKLAPRAKTQSL